MPYFKPKEEKEQIIYSSVYSRILDFIKTKEFIKQEISNREDVALIDEWADRVVLKDLKNKLYIAIQKDLIEILDNYNTSGCSLNIKVLEYYKVSEENLKGEILNILKIIKES